MNDLPAIFFKSFKTCRATAGPIFFHSLGPTVMSDDFFKMSFPDTPATPPWVKQFLGMI